MPHPGYPEQFKQEAVRLVKEGGKTAGAVARTLGISRETVGEWVRQAERDAGERSDGPTSTEILELRQLRRQVKRLEEENEILKKFRAFSREETGQTS
jgi:transposase